MCRPKELGGLGILHLEKFGSALRLRWPWLEWRDPSKIWVGHGNPCTEKDMDLFYAATKITVGNGLKTPFCHAPWLEGRKPKDIAPLIFECSSKKNSSVGHAMLGFSWVGKVCLDAGITTAHLAQFVELWILLHDFHLSDIADSISWKLTESGEYTAKSAYKMQFLGTVSSSMYTSVWKPWAPPRPSSLLGLQTKTGFGRRIGWQGGDGQIVGCVLFASKSWSLQRISLSIVASLVGFGTSSKGGLASSMSPRWIG